MLRRIREKIGLKMITIFTLAMALTAALLFYAGLWLMDELNDFYASESETRLKEQAHGFLSRLTYEQTMRYEAIFQRMATSSAMIAKQAGFFLDHVDVYGKTPLNPDETWVRYPPNGIFSNDSFDSTMAVYWGSSAISTETRAELSALSHVDPILMNAQKANPECEAAHVITESGIRRYYPNTHEVTELPRADVYDMRHDVFYTIAGPKQNPTRKTVWTSVHETTPRNEWVITASTPVYSKMGQHLGTAGLDVPMKRILNDILDDQSLNRFLSVRNGKDLAENLFSFLLDSTGNIIAVPPAYFQAFDLKPGTERLENEGPTLDHRLSEASDEKLREIGRNMIQKDHLLDHFLLDGRPCIIASHSMTSTGWRLGVVISESALLAYLQDTLHALNATTGKMILAFVSATALLLLFSTMMILLFAIRHGVRSPSKEKVESHERMENELIEKYLSEDLMDEELEIEPEDHQVVKPLEEDEPLLLTNSYNKMVKTLQKLNELEKEHTFELQREIADRRRVEEEIRHLSVRLISSSEEGKKELAQDLHDEFGQTLAALHMNAESLQKSIPVELKNHKEGIGDLIELIEHLGDKIRSISSDLRPDLLDDLGLVPTLEWYIKEFTEKRSDIQIDFQAVGFKKRLSSDIELVLYRIFQESMNNVVKHAKAKQVEVRLTYSYPGIIFVIKDDGAGFDEQTKGTDGIGLLGMRERVVVMNGHIDIRSNIGKGTTIRVELPVNG